MSSFIAPAYTTIRQWILKIGLYKLNCPKYSSSGWFFVKALETVSCGDINEWIEKNMGQTFLSQRRKALDKCSKNESTEYLELCDLQEGKIRHN